MSHGLRIYFALPFVLAAAFARGQTASPSAPPTTPVAVENTNAAFVPTDVDVPQANPSRPTITAPAHIPPTGYLQFEQGFNRAVSSPQGVSAQSSITQATKIALTTRILVELLSQPYAYSTTDPAPASSAPGDLDLGAQYVLHKAAGSLPVIAISYIRRVRTGTAANLDSGDFVQSALLLLSGDLPFDFHYDSNIFLNEQRSDDNGGSSTHITRRAQSAQTFSISHPLFNHATNGRLAGVVEISHFTQPFITTPAVRRANTLDLLFSVTYNLRPNIVLDVDVSPRPHLHLNPMAGWLRHHLPAAAPPLARPPPPHQNRRPLQIHQPPLERLTPYSLTPNP